MKVRHDDSWLLLISDQSGRVAVRTKPIDLRARRASRRCSMETDASSREMEGLRANVVGLALPAPRNWARWASMKNVDADRVDLHDLAKSTVALVTS